MSDTTTATASPAPRWYARAFWAAAAVGFAFLWVSKLERALTGDGSTRSQVWDWGLVVILPFTFLWCVGNALGYGAKPKN